MITISLCMIVKDEAKILRRCLSSVADLMDEIIIVDTGSTDRTKEIAAEFTDKIYDYTWENDFAAARNFAFSKASMEYIYSADADEVVDELNRERFSQLKQVLLPEIEVVQMYYVTPPEHNTTGNYQKEYRPKLYKRLRELVWVDAVHETVRLDPVVYDSEIEIRHLPENLHSKRDFQIFRQIYERDGGFSPKLNAMYAKELFISGTKKDFMEAADIFSSILERQDTTDDMKREAICVLCHMYRISGQTERFFSMAFKLMPDAVCAELCFEVGSYFMESGDYMEAVQWFEMAAYRTEAVIDVRRSGRLPLETLGQCCRKLAEQIKEHRAENVRQTKEAAEGWEEQIQYYTNAARQYEKEAAEWQLPEL